MTNSKSVPTLTVGGFLGAGKTTLVNHLLSETNGERVVVFVNDFGAINIDHSLIETVENDRIALSNGCVCCTLNDDLVRSMVDFCENDPPALFVIEASGVADPKSLTTTLHALHQSGLAHLQRRIYVLDADQFGGLNYADTEDLVDHAAASDLVVVNKSDLISTLHLRKIETLLSRSAPATARKVTTHAQVSLSELRDGPFRSPASNGVRLAHDANARFSTLSFCDIPPLTNDHFEALSETMKSTCLRAKGVLFLADPEPRAVLIQLVGRRLETRPVKEDNPQARLVTIGWSNQLDAEALSRSLQVRPFEGLMATG